MNINHSLFAFLLIVYNCQLSAQELRLEGLPNRSGEWISPDLRVRVLTENGQQRLALIATFEIHRSPLMVFNPFGNQELGRPYRVVMMNSEGKIVHTVVKETSASETPHNTEYWIRGYYRGVFGRCFWTRSREVGSDDRHLNDLADLPVLSEGRYSLTLLVSQRMFHAPPDPDKITEMVQSWRESWNDPALDEPCCASDLVILDVDDKGNYQLPVDKEVDSTFQILESDAHLNSQGDLSIITRLVNPSESWILVPGMNLYESTEGSVRVSVVREDRSPFERFKKSWTKSGRGPVMEYDRLLVPRDGVIGGIKPYSGTLETPGKYHITTEIDESIYKDKLFVDGKRVIRKPGEWPIVFRSRTTTITVPEKAP